MKCADLIDYLNPQGFRLFYSRQELLRGSPALRHKVPLHMEFPTMVRIRRGYDDDEWGIEVVHLRDCSDFDSFCQFKGEKSIADPKVFFQNGIFGETFGFKLALSGDEIVFKSDDVKKANEPSGELVGFAHSELRNIKRMVADKSKTDPVFADRLKWAIFVKNKVGYTLFNITDEQEVSDFKKSNKSFRYIA